MGSFAHRALTVGMILPNMILSLYAGVLLVSESIDCTYDVWLALSTATMWVHVLGIVAYCCIDMQSSPTNDLVVSYFTLETFALWIVSRGYKATFISRGLSLYTYHATSLFSDVLLLLFNRKTSSILLGQFNQAI